MRLVDLPKNCSIAEIWSIIVSHSTMVGVDGDFQCLGVVVLATVRQCLKIPLRFLESDHGMRESKMILWDY